MLRQPHKVTRNERRLALIADKNRLCRTSQELYRAIERDEFLGCGHVPVAGTDDLAHAWDALRSIGERRDCLCSTHAVKLAYPEKRCSRQSRLGRMRRHHANLRHAR